MDAGLQPREQEWASAYRPGAAAALIAVLVAREGESPGPLPRTMVVGAHPDDETAFAGFRLPRLAAAHFVCVTDGSPRDGLDAARNGLSPQAYAEARRRELEEVLGLCGVAPARIQCLGHTDQEAALHLVAIARSLAALFARHASEAVLTHPYEGGHPDHDATAFAVHAAAALLRSQGGQAPEIVEMACYHAGGEGTRAGSFLGDASAEAVVHLTPEEQQRKRALLDRFVTQRHTLPYLPVAVERYRRAPPYDFRQPPHAGPLNYERHAWGMTGERFRALAVQALAELGLEPPP
jgi:LmbE family N-acetylglucosaminyl deacetylase